LGESIIASRRGPKTQLAVAPTKLAKAIQQGRVDKSLTTPELAALVEVTDAAITQYEGGQTIPRDPTIRSLEQRLGIELHSLAVEERRRRKKNRKKPTALMRAEGGIRTLKIEGEIAAGEPMEAIEGDYGEIEVAESWLTGIKSPRALRVVGDSMTGFHILDGDVVIVDADKHDYVNRIVAAQVIVGSLHLSTLKVWKEKRRSVILKSGNPEYAPYASFTRKSDVELTVFGVLCRVLRSYAYEQGGAKRKLSLVRNTTAE
jgi:SOS-response transcriptional repressor LexA